jgi:hypothetical protein
MEAWRTKLIESFPALLPELEDQEETIYTALSDLNARCQEAHDRGDRATLAAIYGFAAWCSRQEDKDLWNAAGVSFYEHVVDHPAALLELPHWVPPDVFHSISSLLQWRLGDEEFAKLKGRYAQDRLKGS